MTPKHVEEALMRMATEIRVMMEEFGEEFLPCLRATSKDGTVLICGLDEANEEEDEQ